MGLTPTLFTDDELEGLCNYLPTVDYIYYPQAKNYWSDLYYTGCRPLELLTQSLWTYNSSTDIQLTPLKGNSTRYFLETELSTDLVFAIQNNIRPYGALSYRQLKWVLYKVLPVIEVLTAEKRAPEYMFRYNLVRQLSINGMSDADIAIKFGWSTSARSVAYRTTPVYYIGNLPPFAQDVIIDELNNFLIDSDGTFIQWV